MELRLDFLGHEIQDQNSELTNVLDFCLTRGQVKDVLIPQCERSRQGIWDVNWHVVRPGKKKPTQHCSLK